jgi:hypothetical protein
VRKIRPGRRDNSGIYGNETGNIGTGFEKTFPGWKQARPE